MTKLIHYLAHLTGWYYGYCISEWDKDGNLWSAFQCSTCGKITDKYISITSNRMKL